MRLSRAFAAAALLAACRAAGQAQATEAPSAPSSATRGTQSSVAPGTTTPAAPETGRLLVLAPGDVARLGIRTEPLTPVTHTPRVHGYGTVMDIGALAQADANLATARAAAKQSEADLARSRALFANNAMSRQLLDAAEKQAASDRASLLLAERQEVAQFGPAAPWRGARPAGSVLAELTAGRTLLVRATFPLDTIAADPKTLSMTHLGARQDLASWPASRLWSAPADPTIPGRSVFALVSGSDLQSGEHVLIYAPTGPAVQGERIPADAASPYQFFTPRPLRCELRRLGFRSERAGILKT